LLARDGVRRSFGDLRDPDGQDPIFWASRAQREAADQRVGRRQASVVARRRAMLRRLLLVVLGATVLGAIPPLRVLWDVALVALAALALYVVALAMLARERRRRQVLRRRVVAFDLAARARRNAPSEPWEASGGEGEWVSEEQERELAEVAGR
jgi:hypothetical protein